MLNKLRRIMLYKVNKFAGNMINCDRQIDRMEISRYRYRSLGQF